MHGDRDARERFAQVFNELLDRSSLSSGEITAAAKRHRIGYSTVQSWRTGEHLPRVPDDNPGFTAFLREVAGSGTDLAAAGAAANEAWRESVKAKKHRSGRPEFVGRTGHLAVLATHVRSPDKLVVISGPAGMGKTALAHRLVREAGGRAADNVLSVNLRGSDAEPLTVDQALTHLLASIASGISGSADVLRTTYHHLLSSRRMFLVLDDAVDVDQVVPLLPVSRDCVAVVTSRAPLERLETRHRALRLRLGPLRPEESVELLGRAVRADADRLAELAELCGHVPLALRVAVGQLTTPGAPTLDGYLATVREQRRGLDAQVGLAYRELAPDARELFRRIGQSPCQDVTADAARALLGKPHADCAALLEGLADANLVERRAPGRFGLHDTLRLLATDHAAAEDTESVRTNAVLQLARFYGAGTNAAARWIFPEAPRLVDPPDAPPVEFTSDHQASAWLSAEQFDIIASVSAVAGRDPVLDWALADALRTYQQVRPHGMDWTPVAESALRSAEHEGDRKATAAMHLAVGMANWGIGKLDVTTTHLTSAVLLFRELRMPRERAFALNALGAAEHALGRLQDAQAHCAESLRLRRRFDERRGQSSTLIVLSGICADLGLLPRSAKYASEALALATDTGYAAGVVGALGTLGHVSVQLGQHDEARGHFERQLTMTEDLAFRSRKAIALVGLATVALANRWYEEAIDTANRAATTARDGGNLTAEVDALTVAGSAHLGRDRFTEAFSHFRQAHETAALAGYLRGRVQALIGLSAATREHAPDQSRTHARHAVDLARQSDLRLVRASAEQALHSLGDAVPGP
ncbi:NB-ARC domain-containing protein [Actinosynnema sp. CA-299493]